MLAFFIKKNSVVLWNKKNSRFKNFLVSSLHPRVGRNRFGRITVRHRKASLNSKLIYLINNKLSVFKNEFAQVVRIEYSSQCSSFVALIRLLKAGLLCYIRVPSCVSIGSILAINPDRFSSTFFKKLRIFSSLLPLYRLSRGSFICNVESSFLSGSKFCRSAGTKAKLQAFSVKSGLVSVLMPSGKSVFLPLNSCGFLGGISNSQHQFREFYKAGQIYYFGRRPITRGVAMNPVDHPHGGGEGKTSGGRSSVTPWGKLTKGFKTVSNVKRNKILLLKAKFLLYNKNKF